MTVSNAIAITPGKLFIHAGAILPPEVRAGEALAESGWASIANAPSAGEVEGLIAGSRWRLFYLAGALRATAPGQKSPRTVQAALVKILRRIAALGFNCVEIDSVAAQRYLGVPYTSVMAHSRHLQQGDIAAGAAGWQG